MDLTNLRRNLEAEGFTFRAFDTGRQAADYLVETLHHKTIGFGGSVTLDKLDLYDRLSQDNRVFWHWRTPGPETLAAAANAQVYLTSVNAMAETGQLINIDGTGNRISAASSAKEAVYFIAGVNKVAPDYHQALWRARNVAAPLNARRIGVKTPCVAGELKCYDCKSPQRICRGLSVLWRKLNGVEKCEVLLINEELGF